ncbi:glycoside hydrolase family 3 protein [Sphingomonas ginkgonis]|uniref:Glycoside hydrolase family 3 protein n=2 Tax=Sphingomonas ginkgonis TaxID=2315330 RepID=A0A3R9Z8G6_9SPHN|nr:glycoside hydrolase family 3 protein [Sphingomonas ginkgonis]
MTPDEKLSQLLNVAPAIPRLQVPAYNWWTESLHGALGPVPTTNFPEPIGLGATFDPSLVHSVAAAISREVRALHTLGRSTGHLGTIGTGLDTWSPNINIFRDPRWGRGQETYGEDPFLTATLGVAFITGMQGPDPDLPDVIATPKHFAVHSGPESTRHVADVFVSPHDLEDTYLPAFRAAIVEAKANSVMCAYNRIDGQPACASDLLLKDHLRGAWGFQGYVVSDCDAVVDISDHHKYAPDSAAGVAAALKAGVDNECNTATLSGTPNLEARYREALARGLIGQRDIDRALVRLFSARFRNGDLPGLPQRNSSTVSAAAINTPDHQALALRAAIESMVLLKNDRTLPLAPGVRIALVGPLADATRVLRGNYSSPASAPPISVLEGLRRALPGATIRYVPFMPSITDGDPVPASAFVTPDGAPGLRADYYNARVPDAGKGGPAQFESAPVASQVEPGLASSAATLGKVAERHRTVWTGSLVAPETGTYRIAVTGVTGDMQVGGRAAVRSDRQSGWGDPLKLVTVELRKGERYPLRFETRSGGSGQPGMFWKRISTDDNAALADAARNADVVVAVVGLTSDLEGEEMPVHVEGFSGGDKTSLELPADQRALLEKAHALGKPLVVIAMNGSPINLAWAKANAAAILEAWYPGQSGGLAVAQVLAGAANPAGRLPLTFYRGVEDLAAFNDYAMHNRTYRYYRGTPVYPFGYGLSYTSFDYAPIGLRPASGGVGNGLRVTTEVRNSGARDGDEVAQLYLSFPAVAGAPRLALRGLQRVHLQRGERRALSFDLAPRDLSAVTADGVREVMAGRFTVSVGGGQPGTGAPGRSASFSNDRVRVLPN